MESKRDEERFEKEEGRKHDLRAVGKWMRKREEALDGLWKLCGLWGKPSLVCAREVAFEVAFLIQSLVLRVASVLQDCQGRQRREGNITKRT